MPGDFLLDLVGAAEGFDLARLRVAVEIRGGLAQLQERDAEVGTRPVVGGLLLHDLGEHVVTLLVLLPRQVPVSQLPQQVAKLLVRRGHGE